MSFEMGKAVFLAIVFGPLLSVNAVADTCGDRISQFVTGNKNLAVKQRAHVTSEFDAFYLEGREPSVRITISCGPKISSFDAEWSGSSLKNYSALLGQVSQSLDLGSDDFSSVLEKCWSRAALEDDDDEGGTIVVPSSRAQISCVIKNGEAEISVNRPQ